MDKDLLVWLVLSVDLTLELGDDLMYGGAVGQLSVFADGGLLLLEDGRDLATFPHVVLLGRLRHDEAHAPHPGIGLILLLGHQAATLRQLCVLLQHHDRGVGQLQTRRLDLLLLEHGCIARCLQLLCVTALPAVDAAVVETVRDERGALAPFG